MQETEIYIDKYFKVTYNKQYKVLICKTLVQFIPSSTFQVVFAQMKDAIVQNPIERMIFDKQSLKTFDQNSMTWYHVEWKPQVAKFGLRTHFKILPDDLLFKTSVKVGRERIRKEFPDFRFEDYDIQYCDSIEDAFQKLNKLRAS